MRPENLSIDEIAFYKVSKIEQHSVLEECADLYSHHYGVWGKGSKNEGTNIRLSAKKLLEWLPSDEADIYVARFHENLIGYAIAVRANIYNLGTISWVTQFVVHTDYRNLDIGTYLLRHIWGMSNDYAWGVVTSNPYAIRALEKATRRRSDPLEMIKKCNGKMRAYKLLEFGNSHIGNYINADTECLFTNETSQLNTEFNIDHSMINERIANVSKNGSNWIMGTLRDSWEWFAFTFRSQKQFKLSREEIDRLLSQEYNDALVKQAYTRMLGGDGSTDDGKFYTKYTEYETNFIIKESCISHDAFIIDYGCGNGRHSISFGAKKYHALGIDYISNSIQVCNRQLPEAYASYVNFSVADCRNYESSEPADLIICLYDVIGSFADEDSNLNILKSIYGNLKDNGCAFISVMNAETNIKDVKSFSFKENPNEIFNIKASNAMERNGEVFNSKNMLYDKETGIFYRLEQFNRGNSLPVELVVRDMRFTRETITALCENAGFNIEFLRYVHAGHWDECLDNYDVKSKEILCKLSKRSNEI
jgi:2-polyprenyl-3-methyl-5-hydroxy-6-metoxy-1,4-benzoquinol methylase/GNAT superfamily N-acetyltransferase